MDDSFHVSDRLTEQDFFKLIERNNQPALLRFIIMYSLMIGAGCWAVLAWDAAWWNVAISQIGFAIMVCSTFACLHETAHGTAFESKRLNRIAAFLCGLVHLYPSSLFRELHFAHHRNTHVPGRDPEISLGNRPAPSVIANLPSYFGWLTGLPLLLFKVGMLVVGAIGMPEGLRANVYPFVRPSMRTKVAAECVVVLAFHTTLFLIACYVDSRFWAIFVGQIVGHCLLAAYLTPEHNGLPHEGNILDKTRSVNTGSLVKFVMWNMPYHAEHHAYPAVPFHALPALHLRIKDEIRHRDDGYSQFHLKVLRGKHCQRVDDRVDRET